MNRIVWFDFLKFFAMFLVVWGHCIQRFIIPVDTSQSATYTWIYSFHMPLFMCISGFFGARLVKFNFKEVLSKKFRQLLLPAITFSLLAAIYTVATGVSDNFWFEIKNAFWFLKSAFACSIVYWLLYKLKDYIHIGKSIFVDLLMLLAVIAVFARVQYFALSTMFPSYILGVLLNQYFDRVQQYSGWVVLVSGLLSCILWICLLRGCEDSFIFDTTIGLIASIFFISLFLYLSQFTATQLDKWGGVQALGAETLGIYCVHYFLLLEARRFINLQMLPPVLSEIIIAPLIALAIMWLSGKIIRLIQLSKYTSFLLLGKKLK